MALPYLDTASGTSTNICTIAVTDFNTFQVSASGDMVTVTVAVTFKVAPAGNYQLFLHESYQDTQYLSWSSGALGYYPLGSGSLSTVPVTVTSSPAGLTLTVDGAACTAP